MKKINTLAVSAALAISGLSMQGFLVSAQVNNTLLCLDDATPGWTIPKGNKIILSGKCNDIEKIPGLYKTLSDLWDKNPQYKNMYVIIQWQELKKNHILTTETSPYTDWYNIKIDFNDKSGMSSTTKEYIYYSVSRILKEKRVNI
jgi:hypothetical protein